MIVHILQYGRALCGRRGTPDTWPEGERLVFMDDVFRAMQSHSSEMCSDCLRVYKERTQKETKKRA